MLPSVKDPQFLSFMSEKTILVDLFVYLTKDFNIIYAILNEALLNL